MLQGIFQPRLACPHFQTVLRPGGLGSLEVLSCPQKLGCRWLRPEMHSKELNLKLLVLEKFLAILPWELQCWDWEKHVGIGKEMELIRERENLMNQSSS